MIIDATEFQGADAENEVVGGGGRPGPGIYHVALQHVAEEAAKSSGNPGIAVEFVILAEGLTGYKRKTDAKGRVEAIEGGTQTEGQSGKTMPKFFSFTGKDQAATEFCQKCVTRFALAAGVIQPGEAKEPDWDAAVGRELFIEIERSEYTNRQGQKATGSDLSALGMWSLGNKLMVKVPRDGTTPGMQQLAKNGGPVARPTAPPAGNGAGAATTPPAAAATSRGKYSDL